VQCVYNPEIGREAVWGKGTLERAAQPRKVLVVGAGPAGLEFARVAAARGHEVVVLEREGEVGGHVRLESLLPSRAEYGLIATWLADQARKNGAEVRTSFAVTAENLDEVLAAERPDHVVVATGSRVCRDGFQGWTAGPIAGWESGNCVGWDEVATGAVRPSGDVVVLDDLCHVVGPLTAVALAEGGASTVRLVTRWPMIGLETILDVYLDWILPKLYRAGVELVVDHWVESIDGRRVALVNVHDPERRSEVDAEAVVMVTGRRSENSLHPLLQERGVGVELIGDAIAPRGTYEAVYEGHRQARKV
jgi:NADH dehydrogenase FAD-containing subunit